MLPHKPLLDKALELASSDSVQNTVIVQRHNLEECVLRAPVDLDYETVMSTASPVEAMPLPSNHPHSLLYTAGTTGLPKGVVHDTAPSAVSWKYSMPAFYDTGPGEVFWCASDIGWAVGHAYTVYAPLLNGSTTILYEGKPVGTPGAGAFWRVIDEYGAKALCTAPAALRAIRRADPDAELAKKYDLSSLEALYLAGEHSDPETLHWCENALKGRPVIDYWWQAELGYPCIGNSLGLGMYVAFDVGSTVFCDWEQTFSRHFFLSVIDCPSGLVGALPRCQVTALAY